MIRSRTGVEGRGNPRAPDNPSFYSAQQIVYVGQHGSDTNDGTSMGTAKLTIANAITTASAQVPSASNRFVIYAEDDGIYAEDIVLPSWVSIWMPNAVLQGQSAQSAVVLVANTAVKFREVEGASGQWVFLKSDSTGIAYIDVDVVDVGVGGVGVLNLGTSPGALYYYVRTTNVSAGAIGIGDTSQDQGHIHVECGDVYLIGAAAFGIARIGNGSIVGFIAHVLELGDGIGSGTGIAVLGGEIDLVMNDLAANTAYTVASGATLRLDVGDRDLTGSEINAGTVRITSRADDSAFHNPKSVEGNQTAIASGGGTVVLNLDGATASLVGTRICPAGRRATLGVRVRVQDDDDTDQWQDEWSIGVAAVDASNVRLTDGGGANSGAAAGTATLPLIGRDSTYSYTMVMTSSAGTNLITLEIVQAGQAREAQVDMWWDEAKMWS